MDRQKTAQSLAHQVDLKLSTAVQQLFASAQRPLDGKRISALKRQHREQILSQLQLHIKDAHALIEQSIATFINDASRLDEKDGDKK
jgi:hypothetical protein